MKPMVIKQTATYTKDITRYLAVTSELASQLTTDFHSQLIESNDIIISAEDIVEALNGNNELIGENNDSYYFKIDGKIEKQSFYDWITDRIVNVILPHMDKLEEEMILDVSYTEAVDKSELTDEEKKQVKTKFTSNIGTFANNSQWIEVLSK